MFKKIEIWILYLTLLLSILFAISFGTLVRQELVGDMKAGWVSKSALFLAEIPIYAKRVLFDDDLVLEDRFPSQEGFNGNPNGEESYLLLSRYDGDLGEGIVELIDLRSFKVLHTWNPDIDEFNDLVEKNSEFKYLNRDKNNSRSLLTNPKLLKDGGLVFQNTTPLRKINACSKLVFQNTKNEFHHSIETDNEGNIWVPSHIYPQNLPSKKVGRVIRGEGGFIDDAIVKLSPQGKILFEKSVSEIFLENELEYLLFSVGDYYKDPIHLNSIRPVDFDSKYWLKGDVFISLRHQSMVLLYRPSNNKIIWKGTGEFFHQHDVDILDEHRISIFNNKSKYFIDGDIIDGNNEVLIYNFESREYSTYLSDSLKKEDVRTVTGGRSQIISNGDLFIEETNYGRTLYFNADGSLRWSHVNRSKKGYVHFVEWSRILYKNIDIRNVKNFLNSKGECGE